MVLDERLLDIKTKCKVKFLNYFNISILFMNTTNSISYNEEFY